MVLQAWNTQNSMELSLSGPVGQVYALVVGNDMLLAGTQVIFSSFLASTMLMLPPFLHDQVLNSQYVVRTIMVFKIKI